MTWLINNDNLFLESLVKTFGYVQDKKLFGTTSEPQWVHIGYRTNNEVNNKQKLRATGTQKNPTYSTFELKID